MKLKTRLVIAFFTIIIIPVLMAAMMVSMVCRYQIGVVEKNYGITGTTISDFTNSMQVLARVTEKPYHELKDMSEQASEMEDATELDQFNKKLDRTIAGIWRYRYNIGERNLSWRRCRSIGKTGRFQI